MSPFYTHANFFDFLAIFGVGGGIFEQKGGFSMARGRPRKPRVKVNAILKYIASLPDDSELKQRMTPDKMIALKVYVSQLEYFDDLIIKLKADIDTNGEIELFVQGIQTLRRTNPALSSMMELYRLYGQVYRQIVALVGSAEAIIERQWD